MNKYVYLSENYYRILPVMTRHKRTEPYITIWDFYSYLELKVILAPGKKNGKLDSTDYQNK